MIKAITIAAIIWGLGLLPKTTPPDTDVAEALERLNRGMLIEDKRPRTYLILQSADYQATSRAATTGN